MDKIYSRYRFRLPKIQIRMFNKNNKINSNAKIRSIILRVIIVLLIAILVTYKMFDSVDGIIDKQCQTQAKMLATKVANEQATKIMNKYKYNDLFEFTKDSERKNLDD